MKSDKEKMEFAERSIQEYRKICWEAACEEGEYCLGENKVREIIEAIIKG